jgi:hypothetical protein
MGSQANEAGRWEEYREFQNSMAYTKPLGGPRESHTTTRNSGYGGPALSSHHDRHASRASSLLVASDASSSEESGNRWQNNNPTRSSSSDRKRPAMPDFVELSQMQMRMQPPPPRPSQPTIEISPGIHVRLRGADETWKAIANDFYMPAECMCCESMIFCIQNADYVLCPDCRVVSRMEGASSSGMGGVGLGFKYEDLAKWQEDILREQHVQCRPQAHF